MQDDCPPPTDIAARVAKIEHAVENAKLDLVFSALVDLSNDYGDPQLRQEAIILSGTYRDAIRNRRRMSIRPEDHSRQLSDLQFRALELVHDIQSAAPTRAPEDAPTFAPTERKIYVSYAWADETDPDREALVDRLMADANDAGITIARDKVLMTTGERISAFMKEIGRADRIVVFLSAKYLRSAFCMNELYQIWMAASGDEDNFADRIAVFALVDADVWTLKDRAAHAQYWQDQYRETTKYLADLGERDRIAHLNMKRFAVHVGDILASITDTVLPQDYEELRTFAFGAT